MHNTLQQKPQAGKFIKISGKQRGSADDGAFVITTILITSLAPERPLEVGAQIIFCFLPADNSLRGRSVVVHDTSSIPFGGLCLGLSIS